jgi:hypothetical protein
MLVDQDAIAVALEAALVPGSHVSKAKYTPIYDWHILFNENPDDEKIKLCVSSNMEMKKCLTMRDVASSRDITPSFECVLKDNGNCADALENGQVDAVVVQPKNIEKYDLEHFKPILFEAFDEADKYVIIANSDVSRSELIKASL